MFYVFYTYGMFNIHVFYVGHQYIISIYSFLSGSARIHTEQRTTLVGLFVRKTKHKLYKAYFI